jgi:hypothetical protein
MVISRGHHSPRLAACLRRTSSARWLPEHRRANLEVAILMMWAARRPDHAAFWFLTQAGMLLGFVTTYPVNWWLVRRGG